MPNLLNKSVIRALDIVEHIASYEGTMGITEVSKKAGLDKSTVYRLIVTLEDKGYVAQDEVTRKYHLGRKILELSHIALSQMEMRKLSAPVLDELVKKCNETVHLAILDKGDVFYLDTHECSQAIRIISHVGMRNYPYCTGLGKVLLAYLPDEEMERICQEKGMKQFTPNTITSMDRLRKELKKIRKNGYAIDNGELHIDTRCVAAPVRNHEGRVVTAISISAPSSRLLLNKIKSMSKMVVAAADEISYNLGLGKTSFR